MKSFIIMLLVAGFIAGLVFFAIIKPYLDAVINELGVMVAQAETLNTEPVLRSEVHFTSQVIHSEASSMSKILQHTNGYRALTPSMVENDGGEVQ